MKTVPLLLLSLLAVGRLPATTPADAIVQVQFAWVDPADPATAAIRQAGENAIQQIGSRLITEVSRTLATKGAEDALDVLHLKNYPLPVAAPGQPGVIAVKRTSLRVRDPANAPDSADLAALMSIDKELMDGNSPPKVLVQHIAASGARPAEWRVYRPISVASACLTCHGPADSLLPSVRTKLARLYPTDRALDYSVYEWRGVIRVSLLAPDEVSGKKSAP